MPATQPVLIQSVPFQHHSARMPPELLKKISISFGSVSVFR